MFHCAIYTSVSPSEGVTVNCLSTKKDLEVLKKQKVIPDYKYTTIYSLFSQTTKFENGL